MLRPWKSLLLVPALALAACGGGQNAPVPAENTASQPANHAAPAKNQPANEPAHKDPVDTSAYRKLANTPPAGWVALSKDGKGDIERHIKKLPENFEYAIAVTATKAPGGTEPDAEWQKWGRNATAGILYRVSTGQEDPQAAITKYADSIAAGVPEPKKDGEVAWTSLQGGEVVLVALKNKHGTYICIGIIQDTDNVEKLTQSIVGWAKSIKPE